MSGKSGHYQYYCRATKLKSGPNECGCPNLPREGTEVAVLSAICTQLLESVRVATIFDELKKQWEKRAPDGRKLLELNAEAANLEAQLAKLYDHISVGVLEMEKSLKEFIERMQHKLDATLQNIAILRSRQQLPLWRFGEQ